jgi:CheY-like chemotaxis protein
LERVDFSEVFTLAARHVVPSVLSRFESFSFDYRGPRIAIDIELDRLRRTLHRILCGAVDCLQSGFVMFLAEAEIQGDACRLSVTAAGSGHLGGSVVIEEVLARLGMLSIPAESAAPGARVAGGRCPITGAALDFSCLPGEGALLRATFHFSNFELLADGTDALPQLGPLRAWLISSEDAASDSLTRRLQRLGWAITRFDSCVHAQHHLSRSVRESPAPQLVVAFEFDGATLQAALRLREMLPASTRVAYSVVAGSATLRTPELLPGCEVHIHPFSPAELLAYTSGSDHLRAPRSGHTTISPLLFNDRPMILVVDDNELNRVVACGLLEALGYEATTATHGLEAIDQCRRVAPHAVLMDVDMPVLDGPEATRTLRRLQRAGEIAPCAVIAATAGTSAAQRERCIASGMDGYLVKPLSLPVLQAELRRVTLV